MGDITGAVDNAEVVKIQDNILDIIINPILQLATAVAFALFVFGIFRFLVNRTTNPEESAKGRTHILWGIVALFILLSIWRIYIAIGNALGSKIWFIG